MGNVYKKQGNYEKAIEFYQKAIDINPRKDEAFNNLGNIYVNKGNYEKAMNFY